jgi:hypothetical protein
VNPHEWKVRTGYVKDYIPLPCRLFQAGTFPGSSRQSAPLSRNFKNVDEIYARPDVTAHGNGAYAEPHSIRASRQTWAIFARRPCHHHE